MDLPYIEPLLIYSEVGEWQHPEIESLTRELEKDSNGFLKGDILKVTVNFPDNSFYIIAATDTKGINELMSGDGSVNRYMEFLFLILGEDVWFPGNQFFTGTEYGLEFNDRYKLFTEQWNVTISLDISLNHEANQWWFES